MREIRVRFTDHLTDDFPEVIEQRGFDRLRCLLPVDYAVAGFEYRDLIRDMGCGGMFIETRRRFGKGLRIFIVLSAPGLGSIKISGRIVRASLEGIGVKFDEPLSEAQLRSMLLSRA